MLNFGLDPIVLFRRFSIPQCVIIPSISHAVFITTGTSPAIGFATCNRCTRGIDRGGGGGGIVTLVWYPCLGGSDACFGITALL